MTPVSPVGGEVEHVGGCNAACIGGTHFLHADPPDFVTFGSEGSYFRPGQIGYEIAVALMRAEAERDALLARLEAAESARDEALAAVERVKALAEETDRRARFHDTEDTEGVGLLYTSALRAALTPSAPTEETQA